MVWTGGSFRIRNRGSFGDSESTRPDGRTVQLTTVNKLAKFFTLFGGLAGAISASYTFWINVRPEHTKARFHGSFDYSVGAFEFCRSKDFEVITAPVTFINDGGKTGIITQLRLILREASNPAVFRVYVSSALGNWRPTPGKCIPTEGVRHFSPIAVRAGDNVQEAVVFYPADRNLNIVGSTKKYVVEIQVFKLKSDWLGRLQFDESPSGDTYKLGTFVASPFATKEAETSTIAIYHEDYFKQ